MTCPYCGSSHVVKAGFNKTVGQGNRQKLKCQNCAHIFYRTRESSSRLEDKPIAKRTPRY